jgi:pyruvate kinase
VLSAVHPQHRESATNLVAYLAMRQHDLRGLQDELSVLGLSSLGRSEAHVRAGVERVVRVVRHLLGASPALELAAPAVTDGSARLHAHSHALLGPEPGGRRVRMMVTLPSEAASEPRLVADMVAAGMDCARINCAHDGPEAWVRMADAVRTAARTHARPVRVLMDLGGPKLRTGALAPGPRVVRWKPRRDARGAVLAPARVWLGPAGTEPPPDAEPDAVLHLPAAWCAQVEPGDQVRIEDTRGRRRRLDVTEASGAGCIALTEEGAWVEDGARAALRRRGSEGGTREITAALVQDVPATRQRLLLRRSDPLVLTRDLSPGEPGRRDADGRWLAPPRIPCTFPQAFATARPGHAVSFDDGRISGLIRAVATDRIEVEITRTREGGAWLGEDKGINLPDTPIELIGLTEQDRRHLAVVLGHADLLGLSFVDEPADVAAVHGELTARGAEHVALVLKIETRRGFERLPGLLLEAMRAPAFGVMIARGDLAVECGWERLAEVQEEILWLCEAAHAPVIWATQVLDTMARSGLPSRAEITDAAMSQRAECVMLNKGPHILDAMRALDDILGRMEGHQRKKSSRLRSLSVSDLTVAWTGSPGR